MPKAMRVLIPNNSALGPPPLERVKWAAASGPHQPISVKSVNGGLERKGWSPHKNYQKYVPDAGHRDNMASVEKKSARGQLCRLSTQWWGRI